MTILTPLEELEKQLTILEHQEGQAIARHELGLNQLAKQKAVINAKIAELPQE